MSGKGELCAVALGHKFPWRGQKTALSLHGSASPHPHPPHGIFILILSKNSFSRRFTHWSVALQFRFPSLSMKDCRWYPSISVLLWPQLFWEGGINRSVFLFYNDDGFFPRAEGFGGRFLTTQTLHVLFLCVEISSHTSILLLKPGSVHSGLVSWDDCGWAFPDELHLNSFPTLTSLGQGHIHV